MSIDRRTFTLASVISLGAMALSPLAVAATRKNKRIVLASRPIGKPTVGNFRVEEVAIPALAGGQVLLKTKFLSLDPYMRGRMNAGQSYAARVELNDVMVGGTVSEVVESRNGAFREGDLVTSFSGWQSYEVSSGQGIRKLDPERPLGWVSKSYRLLAAVLQEIGYSISYRSIAARLAELG